MRLVPDTDIVPASANRYLLPHERQVITLHLHPAVFLGPVAVVSAGLIAAVVSTIVTNLSGDALLIIWLVWGLLLLYLVGRVIHWSEEWFVVTAFRLLMVTGLLARDVASMPVGRAAAMRLRRSAMGRLLGYGQLIFEPYGQDQALRRVNYVAYPEQVYLEICGLIYWDPDLDADQASDQDQERPPPSGSESRDSGRANQLGDEIDPADDGWDDDEESGP